MAGNKNNRPVEIRTGLRKLEFQGSPTLPGSASATVEFVLATVLTVRQTVRVPLGRRGGNLRELVGEPRLVSTSSGDSKEPEYRYRRSGPVTNVPD